MQASYTPHKEFPGSARNSDFTLLESLVIFFRLAANAVASFSPEVKQIELSNIINSR